MCGSCWIFAILIVIFAGGHGVIGRLLSIAPLVWLGEVSFAIYMVHQILLKIFTPHPQIFTELVFFPTLIAVVAVLHYAIERPGRAFLAGKVSHTPRLEGSPKLLERWRGEWPARGDLASPGIGRRGASPDLTDSQRIAELERKIGQLTMENDFLKKELEHFRDHHPPAVVSGEAAGLTKPVKPRERAKR
jgi:hypothetical protein